MDSFPQKVILNCFHHCFKQSSNMCLVQQGQCEEEYFCSIQLDETENNVQFSRVGLEILLNPNGYDYLEEQITIKTLGCEIASVSKDAGNDNVCVV